MSFKEIYIYGEVLFDCFENGNNKLGGAPFNVAWNLRGFNLRPKMITSIGNDELGTKVLSYMNKWDMDTSFVHQLNNKKTGVVIVKIDETGNATYTIKDDYAYDYVNIEKNIDNNSIFYNGSLALRNNFNQEVYKNLKKITNINIFVDLNLRTPWWNNNILNNIFNNIRWLKLNDEELLIICKEFQIELLNEKEQLKYLFDNYNIELIIITKGEKGALIIDNKMQTIEMPIVKIENLVDTIGAGDAFVSVIILGLYKEWDKKISLKRAIEFASHVCTLNGSITDDKEFYRKFLIKWKN